jgi:hypothetical protein
MNPVCHVAQRRFRFIDCIVSSDGDDRGPRFSTIPLIPDCDIPSLPI